MAEVKPAEVSAILRQQLSGFKSETELQEVGTVLQVGDGIARIYGLSNVQSGELVEFDNGIQAIVLNLEEDNVGAVLLGPSKGIKGDVSTKVTGRSISTDSTISLFSPRYRKPLMPPKITPPATATQKSSRSPIPINLRDFFTFVPPYELKYLRLSLL